MRKLLSFISIFTFFFTLNVFAKQESNGKVIALKGDVYILEYQKGYKKTRLFVKAVVNPQDIILTSENGAVKIKLADGSSIFIKQNSRIKFSFVSKKSQRIQVSEGGILSRVSKLTVNKGFSVNTPNSVAGVRGTKFIVEHDENKKENRVDVYEGKVDYDQISVSRAKKIESVRGKIVTGHERKYSKKSQAITKGGAISASSDSSSTKRSINNELLNKYESLIDEDVNISGWEFN
ncbi:MAG: FecR domain-containing protein [Spirochaetota bacterium]|nr:FecR domain-containing protein [Spirochaetota bacterium]